MVRVRDFMVADRVHTLLDDLGQEAVGLILAVERKLEAISAPAVSWRMETGETGFFRALAGKRRDFLAVEHARLREYRILISAYSYGTALHVSWLLVASPRFLNDLQRTFSVSPDGESRYEIGAELDLFDMLELNAFVGLARLALKHAIREVSGRNDASRKDAEWATELDDGR